MHASTADVPKAATPGGVRRSLGEVRSAEAKLEKGFDPQEFELDLIGSEEGETDSGKRCQSEAGILERSSHSREADGGKKQLFK